MLGCLKLSHSCLRIFPCIYFGQFLVSCISLFFYFAGSNLLLELFIFNFRRCIFHKSFLSLVCVANFSTLSWLWSPPQPECREQICNIFPLFLYVCHSCVWYYWFVFTMVIFFFFLCVKWIFYCASVLHFSLLVARSSFILSIRLYFGAKFNSWNQLGALSILLNFVRLKSGGTFRGLTWPD